MQKNVTNFMGCDAEYDEAEIVLFGAPFDSTTSFRPGTRFAGQSMRNDSYGLELYSPYQDLELPENLVCDCGDLELAIGSSEKSLEADSEGRKTALPDRRGASGHSGKRPGGRGEISGSAYDPF